MSTFLPGNMGELDEFRPVPLRYPGAAELQEWLDRDFEDILVEEDEIKVEFRSVRDMMMHLKHTGVTGSAPSPGLSISALRVSGHSPTGPYISQRKPRCVWIKCRR